MRAIDLSRPSAKFLKKLPPKQSKQVARKIMELTADAIPHDSKLMRGYNDLRRTDIGEYRIVYRFDERTLFVILVGKRNNDEVYRQLKRL